MSKRKIITDNTKRIVGKKSPKQVDKALEPFVAKNPPKQIPGAKPVTATQALDEFQKKKAADALEKVLGKSVSPLAYKDLNPTPYLGGQAVASGYYQPWKPGNKPTAKDINAMLELLGGMPTSTPPAQFVVNEKTAAKLKASFGAMSDDDLMSMHGLGGIKVAIDNKLHDDQVIAMNTAMAAVHAGAISPTQFAQNYLGTWEDAGWTAVEPSKKEKK